MSLVPFGWRVLWLKLKGGTAIGNLLGRLGQAAIVQTGWWLDDIVHRSWKRTAYRGPIFILGHQRTGTTIVQRSLAGSPDAVGAILLQMLFPAISLWYLGRAGSLLDELLGGHAARIVAARQDRLFGALDRLHRTRLGEIEEDEFFFWTILASGMCANGDAASMDNRKLDYLRQPMFWPEARREAIWRWYESVLKKTAYFAVASQGRSPRPWLIVKNPAFSYRIPELLSRFPDARFLVLHRDPCDAIASRLNLVQGIWSLRRGNQNLSAEQVEIIYQDSLRILRGLEADVDRIPDDRRLELSFERLRANPAGTMASIEAAFGIRAASTPPAPAPKTEIKLSDFGLQVARVRRDLPGLYASKTWETA